MDIYQKKLRKLLRHTDKAYEQYKQHPTSPDFAEAYEQAKNELDDFLIEIRSSIPQGNKTH